LISPITVSMEDRSFTWELMDTLNHGCRSHSPLPPLVRGERQLDEQVGVSTLQFSSMLPLLYINLK
jgi:hypothetical protein